MTVGVWLLRKEMSVLTDLLHDQVEIGPRLLEGILPLLLTAIHEQEEVLGCALDDLVDRPVLDLEDDEADVFGIEYEIGFPPLDVGQVPRQVPVVGPGDSLEEPVESAFAGRGEDLDVVGDHRGHQSASYH